MYGIHDVEFSTEEATKKSLFQMPNFLKRDQPRIVTVRKKDLERLRTGRELAKSHERVSRYQIHGGAIDFQESSFSDSDAQSSGSLLPPR